MEPPSTTFLALPCEPSALQPKPTHLLYALPVEVQLAVLKQLDAPSAARYAEMLTRELSAILASAACCVWSEQYGRLVSDNPQHWPRDQPLDAPHICSGTGAREKGAFVRLWASLTSSCPRCGKQKRRPSYWSGDNIVVDLGRYMHLCDWLKKP